MDRYRVLIGFPGPSMNFGAARSLFLATNGEHDTVVTNSASTFDNFNVLWSRAINMSEGRVPGQTATHFAMIHADVDAGVGWLSTMLREMDQLEADLISAAIPIKDDRGVMSCGIGNPSNAWEPFRRFTVRELLSGQLHGKSEKFGETFDAADVGYSGKPLLHNNGLWVADLRKSVFHETDDDGTFFSFFDFPKKMYRSDCGQVCVSGESEDWFFSRRLFERRARTYITRKVVVAHGGPEYSNDRPWGRYERGDEDTRSTWEKN